MIRSLLFSASLALCFPLVATAHTHQVCHFVQVKHIQSKDNNRLIGTGIGAVAGGLLGNQIGGGKGNTLATVGGAVAGGVVGNQVQKNAQNKKAVYTKERRCERVAD